MRRPATLLSLAATLSLVLTLLMASATLSVGPPQNFVAPLAGNQEVPANASNARGLAKFQLNAAGTELSFILIAANIDNVVAAHIHARAPAGEIANPVVFLLQNQAPGGGPHNGVLATGTIRAGDLFDVFADSTSLAPLIAAIESGQAYVNVHTNDGVAPTNTGPGDIPGGEIRGQIR